MAIVEYRQQPFEVPNVFAAVEVKFPGDWVKKEQLRDYVDLMRSDDKVAVLRVPEDCTDLVPGDGRTRLSVPSLGGRRNN
ncbi:VRR-NUC domain-containing protein [Rubrivivax gelatinosus]|uniref:VRR-NUC domain-containing protein n=1 Tax=Rubrivivax gelatinosus (strain NBRC 100245 / IL144) TaxID=983917 RepID=I0HSD6_RUBGI|nr:VRR-NUC domain-containing protein [Rubrivivax gelatinosus]BAL95923.1 hypothetical protein RGE_25840 [Rubrivivax gelatinosus IL144]